jgi:predicted amidophosphoribosyltransferase
MRLAIVLVFLLGCSGNSRVTSCRDCERDVSKLADACPHCGCPDPGLDTEAFAAKKKEQVDSELRKLELEFEEELKGTKSAPAR